MAHYPAGSRLRLWLRLDLTRCQRRHQSRSLCVDARVPSPSSSSNLLPGATLATLLMLGTLHARRLYEDSKLQQQRVQGAEIEFAADWKATFLQFLPLRFISRRWGEFTSVELPLWLRPYVYHGWARAFHANLEEASWPVEEYPSLRAFFIRKLKDGARPLEISSTNLISPVDGVVVGYGQVKGPGTMIEQVKGFSYSLPALLGAPLQLSGGKDGKLTEDKQTLTTSPSSTGLQVLDVARNIPKSLDKPSKGLFYCVLYLGPGDYHRIHSPSDWKIRLRRHFAGKLFPVNDRAVRTVRNLYVVNERVVLEGEWSQGLMAMAAVGATNVGSIEISFEPELKTNLPLLGQQAPSVVTAQKYGVDGEGLDVKAGDEVAVFNLGSTVVLVFEASVGGEGLNVGLQQGQFKFLLRKGQRVKMGQAIGDVMPISGDHNHMP
ncbi:phosphatidylserine decarboxylase proenzyme 1, mitochondrial [Physcomitrium patens]|uniref:Phosphatidylserine decarboxylase proenzyme 1, mitochondrial n=1 Tax=Physcomitrium patens TaxID=3218 RepID=A0A2K1JX65_PHYPA|nr:phosphatidylserine decarboxylase proenzyme 1, mitochondrial-like [Physcomitrium patens]PNR46118.1 hypothetical protein PHYPA_013237 [Physcomitrium patens]|eukprot:XP_024386143.1 phosphatidylserine decarboxylase proenzyme 1, mitochondrial-like [Physcomitrella patens]